MNTSTIAHRVTVVLVMAAWVNLSLGCGFTYGDRAQTFRYENRLDEAVVTRYLYDGETQELGGIVVPERSTKQQTVMIVGKGVRIRGITESGMQVFERHYLWVEIPLNEIPTIVIE